MASDKKRRKQAKHKTLRPKPATHVHPDGDRRRRETFPRGEDVLADKRARQQFGALPPVDPAWEEE